MQQLVTNTSWRTMFRVSIVANTDHWSESGEAQYAVRGCRHCIATIGVARGSARLLPRLPTESTIRILWTLLFLHSSNSKFDYAYGGRRSCVCHSLRLSYSTVGHIIKTRTRIFQSHWHVVNRENETCTNHNIFRLVTVNRHFGETSGRVGNSTGSRRPRSSGKKNVRCHCRRSRRSGRRYRVTHMMRGVQRQLYRVRETKDESLEPDAYKKKIFLLGF